MVLIAWFLLDENILVLNSSQMLFLKTITLLSKHSFEKQVRSVLNVTSFHIDIWCLIYKIAFINFITFIMKIWGLKDWKMLVFLDNLAFEQTQFWKRWSSFWNLILCFTNKYCKNKYYGQDRDPLLKDRYDMQDRKWFLLICLFSLRIFECWKLENIDF